MSNWQEEFKKKFNANEYFEAQLWGSCEKSRDEVIDFISDLRKQDEEELIKMLPVKNGRTEQLIKDYYEK